MAKDLRVLASGECSLNMSQKPVSGVRRLGQKFLIELLTARGSMKYLPERGCSFLPRLRMLATNECDVQAAFSAAALQVEQNLRADETYRTPDDERFSSAYLERIIIESGTLHLEFTVKSRAGNAVRVITPPLQL